MNIDINKAHLDAIWEEKEARIARNKRFVDFLDDLIKQRKIADLVDEEPCGRLSYVPAEAVAE